MRRLITAVLAAAFAPTGAFAQSGSDVYRDCTAHMVFMQDGRTVSGQPLGNDGRVTYDRFFQRYVISYDNESGHTEMFSLRYIQSMPDGRGRYHDDQENTWVVWDRLRELGGLRLQAQDQQFNGMDATIQITCSE